MNLEKFCLIYVTSSSKEEATKIAKILVKEKLVACANIYDNVSSIYQWKGELQEDTETIIILKTKMSLFEQVSAKIKELHSYECPCIVALPISIGEKNFLDWINNLTV